MTRPLPVPDALTAPFWDGCKRGELLVQQCSSCGRKRHRPAAGCHVCGGQESTWVKITGRGRIYTYTVVHRAFHPAFVDNVPYVVALVEMDEDPSVRFHTQIVDSDPAEGISVGQPVDVVFRPTRDGMVLPFWRPV